MPHGMRKSGMKKAGGYGAVRKAVGGAGSGKNRTRARASQRAINASRKKSAGRGR